MRINNIEKVVDRKDIFFCYSFNLVRFLQYEKGVFPVDQDVHKITKKIYYIFLKTEDLDSALKEWTERKKDNKLFLPKNEEGEG